MSRPDIEVVIPAFNARADIADCIAALRRAGFAARHIIVVDDGSDDGTANIVRDAGITCIETQGSRGAAAARNLGVSRSTAPLVMFVDSDVIVAPDARERILAMLNDAALAAVFGAYDAAPAAPGLVSQYRNLLHRYVHVTGPAMPATFWTGLGAVRRAAFDALGGFDAAQRMMEDVEFGLRLTRSGGVVRLDPALNGTHRKHWTLAGMVRTDLMDRAIPWTRLMQHHGLGRELNLAWRNRVSAVAALLFLLSMPVLFVNEAAVVLALMSLGAFILCNADFLRYLARVKSILFAIAAIGPHLVHTWCAVAGFGWVLLSGLSDRILPR